MIARALVAACALALGLLGAVARAAPSELAQPLPQAALAGEATLRFLGFAVYQARLWVEPGFDANSYAQQPLALELAYLRSFKGSDMARRSLAEMRRQGPLDEAQAQRWQAHMQALFPDVQAGDRITGLHQPGFGASFWMNGRWLGALNDPVFSKYFFGIWLAPQTSEPQLRQALLASTAPASATRP